MVTWQGLPLKYREVRPREHEYVRALGAVPVDYRSDDMPLRVREVSPGGVEAVFDHV